MRQKPNVFFGSSKEGLSIAQVLAACIAPDFDASLWNNGFFTAGRYNLQELERAAAEHDFAVLCGTPDDLLVKRGDTAYALRDNILFELGLFIGRLGLTRTFLVAPRADHLTLPTDLEGLVMVRYDPELFTVDERERIALLQRTAADLRRALFMTASEVREAEARLLKEKLQGARTRAFRNIFNVIVQFRDLLIELPGQIIESLNDPMKFEIVKRDAAVSVDKLASSFRDNAVEAAVTGEFDDLVAATKDAVLRVPHPIHLLPSEDEIKATAKAHIVGAVNDLIRERSPSVYLRDALGAELEKRLSDVAAAYRDWWHRSERLLRRASDALQNALVKGLLELSLPSLPEPSTKR